MTAEVPRRYRRLLTTYPRAWRRQHEAVLLGTLLELHAELGRSGPTLAERVAFAVAGLVQHLRRRRPPVAVQPAHAALFDQTNGIAPASDAPAALDVSARNRRRAELSAGAYSMMWSNHY